MSEVLSLILSTKTNKWTNKTELLTTKVLCCYLQILLPSVPYEHKASPQWGEHYDGHEPLGSLVFTSPTGLSFPQRKRCQQLLGLFFSIDQSPHETGQRMRKCCNAQLIFKHMMWVHNVNVSAVVCLALVTPRLLAFLLLSCLLPDLHLPWCRDRTDTRMHQALGH